MRVRDGNAGQAGRIAKNSRHLRVPLDLFRLLFEEASMVSGQVSKSEVGPELNGLLTKPQEEMLGRLYQ
jgi:hypothetical protein